MYARKNMQKSKLWKTIQQKFFYNFTGFIL